MTDRDYRLLELLLSELIGEIGERIVICPEYIHDGVFIGKYNGEGKLIKEAVAQDIKTCVSKLGE